MPGSTPVYGLPYLELDDPPDIAGATQDLAEAVEAELQAVAATPQPAAHYQGANDTSGAQTYLAGTDNGVTFTAPSSGKVYVSISASLGTNAVIGGAGAWLSFEVRLGSSIGSGTVVLAADDSRSAGPNRPNNPTSGTKYVPASARILVGSLTPGATYNARSMFRSDTSGATTAVLNRYILVEPVL